MATLSYATPGSFIETSLLNESESGELFIINKARP